MKEIGKVEKMCIDCPASLTCMTDRIVEPHRCRRCKRVEAAIYGRKPGVEGIFKVAFSCPRVRYSDTTVDRYYCIECAAEIEKGNYKHDGDGYASKKIKVDWRRSGR